MVILSYKFITFSHYVNFYTVHHTLSSITTNQHTPPLRFNKVAMVAAFVCPRLLCGGHTGHSQPSCSAPFFYDVTGLLVIEHTVYDLSFIQFPW